MVTQAYRPSIWRLRQEGPGSRLAWASQYNWRAGEHTTLLVTLCLPGQELMCAVCLSRLAHDEESQSEPASAMVWTAVPHPHPHPR